MTPHKKTGPVGWYYYIQTIVVSLGFFGILGAFNAAQALATSDNGALGSICLAVLYTTFTLTCCVAPKAVDYLGPKACMLIGGAPYLAMILANLKPSYTLSIPANLAVGLGAPLLWTGQLVFLSRCALQHAAQSGMSPDVATSKFNGLFFSLYQLNGAVGTTATSVILSSVTGDVRTVLYLSLGGLAVLGWLVLWLVQQVEPVGNSKERDDVSMLQTLRLIKADARIRCVILVVFYNGLSLGYIFGVYPLAFTGPVLGKTYTGYVSASFYLANTIFTYASGLLAGTRFGRRGLVILASMANLGFFVFLYLWPVPCHYPNDTCATVDGLTPSTYEYVLIFAGAIGFALGDAVWESQLPAILQSWFTSSPVDSDAAMANIKMWQSLGFACQFLIQSLGMAAKVNAVVLLAVLLAGSIVLLVGDRCIASLDSRQDGFARLDGRLDGVIGSVEAYERGQMTG